MNEVNFLVLKDGTVFKGKSFGQLPPYAAELKPKVTIEKSAGEVVFNTGMTGYHEILTDPSYSGQLITMTYPHIGNYGDSADWSEIGPEEGVDRPGVKPSGLIVRAYYDGPVPEDRLTLHQFLKNNNTPGITGIDTRRLTLLLRDKGSQSAVIVRADDSHSGELDAAEIKNCLDFLNAYPDMEGQDLTGIVGTTENFVYNPKGSIHFVVVDCGLKENIVRELVNLDCKVTVVSDSISAQQLLKLNPAGIMMSNGPGDPGVLTEKVSLVKELVGKLPVFGICLGHQIIGQALGAKTYKMKFGHHGVNHPVRDEDTGKVFVTSQNHGFAVDEATLPKDVAVWCRNANDNSIEGIYHKKLPVMCVQFHPEASPGPHDSSWIFKAFLERAKKENS